MDFRRSRAVKDTTEDGKSLRRVPRGASPRRGEEPAVTQKLFPDRRREKNCGFIRKIDSFFWGREIFSARSACPK